MFRIVRRVAKDRDLDCGPRHPSQSQTSAREFDSYKRHVAVDPDSELIVSTTTAGNVGIARRSTRCWLRISRALRSRGVRASRRPSLSSRQPDQTSHQPRPMMSGCRSTVIPPTALSACCTRSSRPTLRSCARSSRRTRPPYATRRTRFRSTWTRAPSRALPDRPPSCGRSRMSTSPTSPRRVRDARSIKQPTGLGRAPPVISVT